MKKTTKKKRSKPKVLSAAHHSKYFILCDGNKVKSVKELADILENNENYLKHHVREDSNDFALWIEHVFNSKKLAELVNNCEDTNQIRLTIYKFLLEVR